MTEGKDCHMYLVDESLCNGCGVCLDLCPAGAIRVEGGVAVIVQDECSECGHCFDACMRDAVFELSQPAGALEPAAAASPVSTRGGVRRPAAVPATCAGPSSPARLEKAGTALAAALPVVLKLAGALADYLSARAARMPGTSGGGPPVSRGMGGGHQGRHRRRGA